MKKSKIKNTLTFGLVSVLIFAGAVSSGAAICKHKTLKTCHVVKPHCKSTSYTKQQKTFETVFSQADCMTYVEKQPASVTPRNDNASYRVDSLMSSIDIFYSSPHKSLSSIDLSASKVRFQNGPLYLLNRQFIL